MIKTFKNNHLIISPSLQTVNLIATLNMNINLGPGVSHSSRYRRRIVARPAADSHRDSLISGENSLDHLFIGIGLYPRPIEGGGVRLLSVSGPTSGAEPKACNTRPTPLANDSSARPAPS